MSTVIRQGYLLPKMSLLELSEFCRRFRSELQPILMRMLQVKVARFAAEVIDFSTCNDKPVPPNTKPLGHAFSYIQGRYTDIRKTGYRDPEFDFECNIHVYPIRNGRQTNNLVILRTEQQEFVDLWLKQPQVVSYSYWDNVDKPASISDEQWEQRDKNWEQALSGSFDDNALVFRCVDQFLPRPAPETILGYVPSLRDRVIIRVENEMFTYGFFPKWKKDHHSPALDIETASTHDILAALGDFATWKRNDGRAEVEAEVTNAVEKLKKELTVVDLLGWDPSTKKRES